MQLHPNYRNVVAAVVVLFFIYLIYILFGPNNNLYVLPPHLQVDLRELINYCILAVECGGYAVRRIYESGAMDVQMKGLSSEGAKLLLTKADLTSNQIILDLLTKFPGINIISEEKKKMSAEDIQPYKPDKFKLWQTNRAMLNLVPTRGVTLEDTVVWVDPLDATQEFTVWGLKDHFVYSSLTNSSVSIPASPNHTIVVSRSHAGAVRKLVKNVDEFEIEAAGGAGYKTLRVLNGTAAAYIHKTLINKWDICAGDAILRATGGRMVTLQGHDIRYDETGDARLTDGLIAAKSPLTFLHNLNVK